jgi:hypothetical protein
MVLKRQVEKPSEDLEKAREEFIRGGGLVASDVKKEEAKNEEWTKLSLRIKISAIDEIDSKLENKMGLTRTGWILQAIEEKLERERQT